MSEGSSHHSRTRRRRAVVAVLALTGLGLAGGSAVAQVSVEWTQFQGDVGHTGVVPGGPRPPFARLWHAGFTATGALGGQGLSAPVVSGDLVIAVGPDQVVAFALGDGSQAWSVPRAAGPVSQPAIASVGDRSLLLYTEGGAVERPRGSRTPSPSSSPADGTAATATVLVGLDLRTQEPAWDPVPLPEVSRSGVTADGDRGYVVDESGEVFAIDLSSGSVTWTQPIDRIVNTPVALDGDLVIVTGRGDTGSPGASIVALDADGGARRWRREIDAPGVVVPSAPSVEGGRVVATFTDFTVRAWDRDSGEPLWTARVGYPPSFPPIPLDSGVALDDDAVYVGDQIGSIFRLDARTGEPVWDFAINERITFGAPVLSDGALLIGTDEGTVHALDADTGDRVSRIGSGGEVRSVTLAGSTVVAVRTGARAGLDAFAHDPDGALVREASPTTPAPLRMVWSFVLAAVPVGGVGLAIGRLLKGRVGPAFEPSTEDGVDDAGPDA